MNPFAELTHCVREFKATKYSFQADMVKQETKTASNNLFINKLMHSHHSWSVSTAILGFEKAFNKLHMTIFDSRETMAVKNTRLHDSTLSFPLWIELVDNND